MKNNFFALTECFGETQGFIAQSAEQWDNLHTSTKQNCNSVWAETEDELENLYYIEVSKNDPNFIFIR